ncbi:MAG: hypothetical protein WDO15_10100 [Bacteroidota bacterium]
MKTLISAALVLVINLCFGQANTWSSLHDLNGSARDLAAAFSIGSKVYVGTGLVQSTLTPLKDVWEYDIAGDTWTQKNDFGGAVRIGAVGFAINGKGYIALGGDLAGNAYNDIWNTIKSTTHGQRRLTFPEVRAPEVLCLLSTTKHISAQAKDQLLATMICGSSIPLRMYGRRSWHYPQQKELTLLRLR